jgi:hypothetical protein
MDISVKTAELLDIELGKLSAQSEKATSDFIFEFLKLYETLKPIISVLRKHEIRFGHPNLPGYPNPVGGPIVGAFGEPLSKVYVLENNHVVLKTPAGGIIEGSPSVSVPEFLAEHSASFALRGLKWVEDNLVQIVSDKRNRVAKIALSANTARLAYQEPSITKALEGLLQL